MIKNFIALSLLLLISCSTAQKKQNCQNTSSIGNQGAGINTIYSEIQIKNNNDELNYLSKYNKNESDIYRVVEKNSLITDLNENKLSAKLTDIGLPTVYKSNEFTYYIFSAVRLNDTLNRDLFGYVYQNGNYLKEIDLSNINTDEFEGHPTLSDGTLFFTSDRNGSWDIFKAKLWDDKFENLEVVSGLDTESDEGFPYVLNDKVLFSKRVAGEMNIFTAGYDNGSANNTRELQSPINTIHNEISPTIYGSKIYFSSDRPGGCGEYDIYAFDFCNEVKLTGNITSEFQNVPLSGEISLLDKDENVLDRRNITEVPSFEFKLEANNKYRLEYSNKCFNVEKLSDWFTAPCSDTSNVVITQDIYLPKMETQFTFEEYDIPFFVTGYYRPNTSENLEELKRLFKQGVITGKDSTAYIEFPNEDYEKYANEIDTAFNSAIEYIDQRYSELQGGCTPLNTQIVVEITGYADPRQIFENAKYPGPQLADNSGNLIVESGDKMDNSLLSFLRAFYTSEYLKGKLGEKSGKIMWNVITGGIDENDKRPNELKRRVSINISIQQVNTEG